MDKDYIINTCTEQVFKWNSNRSSEVWSFHNTRIYWPVRANIQLKKSRRELFNHLKNVLNACFWSITFFTWSDADLGFFPISSQLWILNPTCFSPCKVITNDTQGSAWVVSKFSIRSAVNLWIQYFGHKLLFSYERNPNIFAFFLLLCKALD